MGVTYQSSAVSSAGVVLASYGAAIDPSSGAWSFDYVGTKTQIETLSSTLSLAGIRHTKTISGSECRLTAIYSADPNSAVPETPSDVYGLSMELVSVDIFAHPAMAGFFQTVNTATAAEDILVNAERKKLIDDFLSDPTSDLATAISAIPGGIEVMTYKARGGETFTLKRPVFSRQREYSISYSERRTIDPNPKVYTRAGLISAFNIPASVQGMIPEDPSSTPPTRCVWAWQLRQDNIETIPTLSRVRETMDWVFGAWQTDFFEVIS